MILITIEALIYMYCMHDVNTLATSDVANGGHGRVQLKVTCANKSKGQYTLIEQSNILLKKSAGQDELMLTMTVILSQNAADRGNTP